MKKTIFYLFVVLSFVSCEKPSECFDSTGTIVTRFENVTPFTRIEVYRGIEVVITQGSEYKVQVEAGENQIDNIEIKQTGNIITFKDNTSCNWLRDFGTVKVYVTAPNLEDIYSKTERNISSNGVLNYPTIRLFALDRDGDGIEGAGTGDFILNVNTNQLVIETNNVARYYLTGTAFDSFINFYAGDSRVEAQNLTMQNLTFFHRGTNDMIVKPTQSIKGKLVSTGNVVLKNNPPVIDVQQLFTGQLIYN
jgi:hypothetical protein